MPNNVVGGMERGLYYLLQLKVGLYFRLVEIISRGPRFLAIVTPVPRGHLVVTAFRPNRVRASSAASSAARSRAFSHTVPRSERTFSGVFAMVSSSL